MPDPSATQGQPLPPEIAEIIKAQVTEQVQARVSGFQRLVSERDEDLRRARTSLRELQTASLSPEEQAQFQQQEQADEIARLTALVELNDLMGQYPEEAPYFSKIIKAGSTLEQLNAFREARLAWAPVAAAAASPTGLTPPAPGSIDPNRPATATSPSSFQDGQPMTDDMADMLLNGASVGSAPQASWSQRK